MKNKLKQYFRYQHFHTHPAKEDHSHYIDCLNTLAYYSDTILDCDKSINEDWTEILDAINKLTDNRIADLIIKITTH